MARKPCRGQTRGLRCRGAGEYERNIYGATDWKTGGADSIEFIAREGQISGGYRHRADIRRRIIGATIIARILHPSPLSSWHDEKVLRETIVRIGREQVVVSWGSVQDIAVAGGATRRRCSNRFGFIANGPDLETVV